MTHFLTPPNVTSVLATIVPGSELYFRITCLIL